MDTKYDILIIELLAIHDIIKTAERRMPVSQDSSFINDYSKVKEQVIMVIEYLQQIKDSYFEQKHAFSIKRKYRNDKNVGGNK